MKHRQLLVIIPAYNEELNIKKIINNLQEKYPEYGYVVVNDGSTDATSDVCHKGGYPIIDLPVNLGLAGAFQTGLKYAYRNNYDYAVQFDGDGQHKAEYLEEMLGKIKEGYDIVIGSRFLKKKKKHSARMFGSRIISFVIKITTGVKLTDPTSGMRMFSRKMMKEFASNLNYGPEPDTISYLIKNNAKVAEIQVEMNEREFGTSYLNFYRSVSYMSKMILSILFVQNFRKRK